MSSSLSSYWDLIDQQDVSKLDFLLSKVDKSIFEVNNEYGCCLLEASLDICFKNSQISSVQSQLLLATFIKRIFILYRDFGEVIPLKYFNLSKEFVFLNWDSVADVLCHDSVEIFTLLVDNHSQDCGICSRRKTCELMRNLLDQLLKSENVCRSRFKCILHFMKILDISNEISDEFVANVYKALENPSTAVVASDIIGYLLTVECNLEDHLENLAKCLESSSELMKSAVKSRLLPILQKKNLLTPFFVSALLAKFSVKAMDSLDSLLCVARFAISSKNKNKVVLWTDLIDKKVMTAGLLNADGNIRLSAWTLLVEHPKTSQPLSLEDLELMKMFLMTNMSEQVPSSRQKIVASLKKALMRMTDSADACLKKKSENLDILDNYEQFFNFLVNLCFESLQEGANFSRRVSSMAILDLIYVKQTMISENSAPMFRERLNLNRLLTKEHFERLVGCLDDSFQLCQVMALDLLKNLHFSGEFDFEAFLEETVQMMQSIRSYDTLSSGYRLQLYIFKYPEAIRALLTKFVVLCTEKVEIGEKLLMDITTNALHPILNTMELLLAGADYQQIRSDVDQNWWKHFVSQQLLPLCFHVVNLVTPVVHSLSPEGYIPEDKMHALDSRSFTKLHAETAQLLLACCWRSHKHVSSILAWTVEKLFPLGLLTVAEVEAIGNYYWAQMTECKHCGAFESAVEGFTHLCKFLWNSTAEGLPKPADWLQNILTALEGKGDLENLCSTRRSAGLPYLVCAIVATEPVKNQNSSLLHALASLLEMDNKSVDYRIHCLNVLKALFSDTRLRERVLVALEWACRVAIDACSSNSWSERNSGAQLTSALIVRIFGVSRSTQRDLVVDPRNRMSSFEFFTRFPSLYGYLFHSLSACSSEFVLYPILIILSHLFPSSSKKFPLAPFIPVCMKILLSCKSEKLRNLTAATTIYIAEEDDIALILDSICQQGLESMQQNHVHAVLLLMDFILQKKASTRQQQQVVAYLKELAGKPEVVKLWCDYNRNILENLCLREDIDSQVQLTADCKLTVRPFIYGHLQKRRPFVYSDKYRREFFRAAQRLDFKIKQEEPALFDYDQVFRDSLAYLEKAVERDAFNVLTFLDNNLTIIPDKSIVGDVMKKLLESRWNLSPTRLLANKLLMKLGRLEDTRWFIDMIVQEDYDCQDMTLELAAELLDKYPSSELVDHLAEFLQDEDEDVREQTARLLTPNYKHDCTWPVNPYLLYWLLKCQNNEKADSRLAAGDQTTSQPSNSDGLFDVCESRPYAEKRLFGELALITFFQQHLQP